MSEGYSYWAVTSAFGFFGDEAVRARAGTEEHARDSYENLLFSICRFRQLTGRWPRNVTVVGYEFKRPRFMDLHRGAISFPRARMAYLGNAIPNEAAARAGEAVTEAEFARDPYGCGAKLAGKRAARDPFATGTTYREGCPELRALLEHCGPRIFLGRLPWDDPESDADAAAAGGGDAPPAAGGGGEASASETRRRIQ